MTIDVSDGTHRFERIGFPPVLGPVDYAFEQTKKKDCLVFGKGLFAGSVLPGSNRLIFAARSPLWGGFYLSTMGGAALVFDTLGIEFVSITGHAPSPSVLLLKREAGQVHVLIDPIDAKTIWKGGHEGEIGFYALHQAIFARYGSQFSDCRILATGPAALETTMGAIGSAPIKKGKITPVDTWAGRGGLGSKMVRDHNIVGVIYGGDYDEPDNWRDRKAVDGEFIKRFDRTMIKTDRDMTLKYRFDPQVDSGGTLGVNFSTLKDWLLSFNYRSIYLDDDARMKIHDRMIKNHYLRQFNEETIKTKSFANCGEPCPAVCKKMKDRHKKDYEPYQALGPLVGIFDQRAAELLNRRCDAAGFDAIQLGGIIAWLMELLDRKLIAPKDVGTDSLPRFSPDDFDIVNDSMHNAKIGLNIIDFLLGDKAGNMQFGLRRAAKELDKKHGINSKDLAVYNANGEQGSVAPNQYWAPGLFAPMPIMGKYFQFYKMKFLPPYELGVKSAKRMVRELYSDNNGMCRFHRGWGEEILPDLIEKHYGERIDFEAHHLALAKKIHADNKPVFWESERIVDMVHLFLHKDDSDDPQLIKWRKRFDEDKHKAAREYWDELKAGVDSVLK